MQATHQTYYLVMGLGSSGMSMARFLHGQGKQVKATEIDGSKTEEANSLRDLGIPTELGFHDQNTFDQALAIVVSPGIPLTLAPLARAAAKGVPITGDLDIFSQFNTTPVIAITGTNGKTTTTTLIREMLEASGMKTFTGGNIGTPLVNYLMEGQAADWVVAEISSFQLDLARHFKPNIALLLNVAEDHLDRYPQFQDYIHSKWSIFKHQTSSDRAVINQAIDGFETKVSQLNSRVFGFSWQPGSDSPWQGARIGEESIHIQMKDSSYTIDTTALKELQGCHNRENIAAAALASVLAGAPMEGILKGLAAFKSLPHRMGFVRQINGVLFYNDSKATNTDAVIRALESLKGNIILILGGREKGTDFTLLIPRIKTCVKQIIALGEATQHIIETLGGLCPILAADSMETAVTRAYESADPQDIVLLSPACASFDMYENYKARGHDFMAQVNQLADCLERYHGNR